MYTYTAWCSDAQGRKMSKSLGNGIDPLEIIDQYGADALRFMLTTGITPGNDMRFKTDKLESARNFANKLWNASRFVIMNLQDEDGSFRPMADIAGADRDRLQDEDKWMHLESQRRSEIHNGVHGEIRSGTGRAA